MPKKKELESELDELLEQLSFAELLEFVLDRAEAQAEGVFATDISIHAREIRKLIDSFSSEKKSRFAPVSYASPLRAPWALLLLRKLAFSEREVAQTLTFAAMHFGAALEQANLWPRIQDFESWRVASKTNLSNANKAKIAKAEEHRQLCRDRVVKEDRSITKAAKRIEKLIRHKDLLPADERPSVRTIMTYIRDLFPMRVKTKPTTTIS